GGEERGLKRALAVGFEIDDALGIIRGRRRRRRVVRRAAACEREAAVIAPRRPWEVLAGAPGTDGGHLALLFDLQIVAASADRCEPAVPSAIRGPGAAVSGRGLCARCRAPSRPRRLCRDARGTRP